MYLWQVRRGGDLNEYEFPLPFKKNYAFYERISEITLKILRIFQAFYFKVALQ